MSRKAPEKIPAFNSWKLALPVLLGFAVSGYLIYSTFKPESLAAIRFNYQLLAGLVLAAFTVLLRDSAFIYKIRFSCDNAISWKTAIVVIMLWEFGSCVSPGAVGGIAVALFLLAGEGISYGRSAAIVLLNTFLDNMAFVVVFAVLYLFLGNDMFNVSATCADLQGHPILQGVRGLASKVWIGYWVYVCIVLLLGTALFLLPHTTRRVLHFAAGLPFLQFASEWLIRFGTDIEAAGNEFGRRGFSFWVPMVLATFVNWMARFALPNALFFGFAEQPLNVLDIYARQFVTWIFIVLPTTPGASGVAEMAFMAMNCEFMPEGLSAAITTLWRIYSYYIYLVIGALILRVWLKGVFKK
ncbi:MAG: flippase-like domain-containing protein [Chitinophagales bacterium]|nr:flippase-like domain-containing protein [Chitinophagales bacterium]